MSVTFTTRGYIEVRRDGEFISRHRVETEAIESALTHAGSAGSGRYTLHFPNKDIDVLIQARRDITPPPQVSGVSAVAISASQITVSWSAASDATGIAFYIVERSTDNVNWVQVGAPTGTTFTDGGLTASTLYRYRILAVDGDQNTGVIYSGTVSATTQSGSQPSTPPFQWTIPDEPYPLGDVQQGSTVSLASLYSVDTGVTPEFTVISGDTDRLTVNSATGAITVLPGAALGTATIRIFGGQQGAIVGNFEPVLANEDQPEQFATNDDGVTSPTYQRWNPRLRLLWTNINTGDFVDANDTSQGAVPFVSVALPTANQWYDFNVSTLVTRALTTGENKGWYLKPSGSSPSVPMDGRMGTNPPTLTVVTNTGTYECPCLCTANWTYPPANSLPSDGRTTFRVTNSRFAIVRFDLSDVTGTVSSATMRLYVGARTGSSVFVNVYEANPPRFQTGLNGDTPRTDGLASEYPGDAMVSDPDVLMVGHFGGTSVQATPQTTSTKSTTSPSMTGARISYQVGGPVDDPDAPGTAYWRGEVRNVVPGSAGRDPLIVYRRVMYADTGDPSYPVDTSTLLEEAYFRLYVMMESDWVDTSEGCKFGITWDLRLGQWDSVAGWWATRGGNSNHISDGKRHLGQCHSPALNPEWSWTTGPPNWTPRTDQVYLGGSDYYSHPDYATNVYKGHMQRQEPTFRGAAGTPYADVYGLLGYNYSNLLFDPTDVNAYDAFAGDGGAFFITGNLQKVMLKVSRWYCIEQRCKMNSIVGPFDALGNGSAVADGELETWVNGIRMDLVDNLQWRCHPDMGIMQAGTVWYVGGNGTTSWPEPWHFRTSHFAFARRYIGPRVRP